ncbi:MAG TPA: thioredoxin domain-containing protein, partial [Actinomycetota bacterium]|nr:thioredoxin domain-containing protein [Actinomycetota bacterium]
MVVDLTLRQMARGGIYDQLGGGFHGASLDDQWMVPSFEKTLSDNALLARVYTHAWQLRQEPFYRRIASETLEYLLRDLSDPGGGFYRGEGADREDEGGFYLWAYDEVLSIAPEATEYYGVTPDGNFKGKNVLSAKGDEPPGLSTEPRRKPTGKSHLYLR